MPRPTSFAAFLFCFVLLLFAGWILLLPLRETNQLSRLKAHHLRISRFPVWAISQLVPSMYNFAHRGRIMAPAGSPENSFEWTNHYPPRMITFNPFRHNLHSPVYFYFESRYRRQKLESIYQVQFQSGTLQMRLVEAKNDNH